MAFATSSEYAARFPDDTIATSVLSRMLDEASDLIEGELAPRGIDYENPSDSYADKLARVCCGMVHRAYLAGQNTYAPIGATQFSQTAGPYTMSATIPGGFGDVFMNKSDRIKLGIAQGTYVYAEPYGGDDV